MFIHAETHDPITPLNSVLLCIVPQLLLFREGQPSEDGVTSIPVQIVTCF